MPRKHQVAGATPVGSSHGDLAQQVERLNGIQKVRDSISLVSITPFKLRWQSGPLVWVRFQVRLQGRAPRLLSSVGRAVRS